MMVRGTQWVAVGSLAIPGALAYIQGHKSVQGLPGFASEPAATQDTRL